MDSWVEKGLDGRKQLSPNLTWDFPCLPLPFHWNPRECYIAWRKTPSLGWWLWLEESDSLLIWPDPTPTRQTSTQRPDSQILTFKSFHKMNETQQLMMRMMSREEITVLVIQFYSVRDWKTVSAKDYFTSPRIMNHILQCIWVGI